MLVKEVAGIMQEYTQRGFVILPWLYYSFTFLISGVRPFGVSLLIAGTDSTGHHLYQVDPSGTYFAWKASAIGKNMINAKTFLEKRYSDCLKWKEF